MDVIFLILCGWIGLAIYLWWKSGEGHRELERSQENARPLHAIKGSMEADFAERQRQAQHLAQYTEFQKARGLVSRLAPAPRPDVLGTKVRLWMSIVEVDADGCAHLAGSHFYEQFSSSGYWRARIQLQPDDAIRFNRGQKVWLTGSIVGFSEDAEVGLQLDDTTLAGIWIGRCDINSGFRADQL